LTLIFGDDTPIIEVFFKGGDHMKGFMKKGFTLIELLIVIALLGALAIGLIGALDPFEQLKKGTDTGVRNTVSEIHSAIIRYYALKGSMPWCDAGDNLCTGAGAIFGASMGPSGAMLNSTGMSQVVANIVDTGELKSNFSTVQASQLGKISVTGSSQDVAVCFKPDSKSFRADNNTRYDQYGLTTTSCGGTATHCYWCVQ